MSLLLVMEHFGGLSLPGCGEGGACEQAANSVWGKVPLGSFDWPVSFLGLAYFVSLFAVWLGVRGGVPRAFRYLVRLGALVSLGFCLIIVVERTFCPYCIAAHAGNFAFWITMESARIPFRRFRFAAVTFGAAFVLVSLVLGIFDARHRGMLREKAESERSVAAQQIIDQSRDPHEETSDVEAADGDVSAEEPPGVEAPAEQSSDTAPQATEPSADGTPVAGSPETETPGVEPAGEEAPITGSPGEGAPAQETQPSATSPNEPEGTDVSGADQSVFTGRYRSGPEEAPIRIVLITDYQCRDCYSIEQQVETLRQTRSDISISVKHFPFNTDCNPAVSRTMHSNACWAARAAEAAGMLWGSEGFWKMHTWLFSRRGVFQTTAELEGAIRDMGYDPTGFTRLMSSQKTLDPIQVDTEEAKRLGLHFTPMIFINGVELKGWSAPNALIRTVEQVAEANPPPRSAAYDRPPLAFDKYVEDWRQQTQVPLPRHAQEWTIGPENADIDILLWGDYQESGTKLADTIIREFANERSDVRYSYRHFPFNSDCNPNLDDRRHPNACRAALAAETAGRLGGNEGYWKMHAWLMENQDRFSDEGVRQAAQGMGFDPEAFVSSMADSMLQESILQDIQAGGRLPRLRYGMPAGIYGVPAIFVNGRFVPRWSLGDRPVLREILEKAVDGPAGSTTSTTREP
jgi:protein-disulfide isomerase